MAKKRIKAVLAWLLVCSMVLPMFSTTISAKATDTNITVDYDTMTIEQIFAQDKSLTWVFAGDSITHNAGWSGAMNSYSEWFEQYLYDIGRGDDSVVLTAWGGANTYDFQYDENTPSGYGKNADPGKGLDNMITKYNPDVVFLKLGMNERYKLTTNIVKTYNAILDGIYAEGELNGKKPKVILLSATPMSDETWYDDQAHPTYTDDIRGSVRRAKELMEDIAEERGLTFCDLRTAFLEESLRLGEDYSRTFYSDSSDGGIHPNAAGQYYIFKTLSKKLGIYDESMPIYQLTYEDILSHALYVDTTETVTYAGTEDNSYGSENGWDTAITENYVWAVSGAQQMSGYEGPIAERSLFRYLDNAMRAGSGEPEEQCRDIRLFNLASPAYANGVADLLEKYDTTMAIRDYDVFLLLPEVPNVYESTYEHSDDLVTAYKANVQSLLEKNSDKVQILWTPLASGDETINGYIAKYAAAIREIATEDSSILFFDANKFMNDNMSSNASLVNNWFEDGAYISPLCSVDVARAFYTLMNQTGIATSVLKNHNLRYTSDTQVFKGNDVRDYVEAKATVTGTEVSVDASAIKEAYSTVENLKLVVLPTKGAGNYNTENRDLTEVANVVQNDNVYTFQAPCSDLNLAIYGEAGGLTYRFKDISVKVDTTATIPKRTTAESDGVYLDSLEVMSAPDFGFEQDTLTYTVDLYQYQTYARVRATAQAGLTIQVNGETVASNAMSNPIKVEDGSVITIDVTDGTETKTYTLNCSKPEQPDIIITEVMQEGYTKYEGAGNDIYELVEIYNASGRELDLLDYSLGFKKDYTYNKVTVSNGAEYPYYFVGNEQAFGGNASYTGIKPITKYSSYWAGVESEPERIPFPADSTMVIWIRSATGSTEEVRTEYYQSYTYETLKTALEEHLGTHTLSVDVDGTDTAVVPQESQLVVAELTTNITSSVITNRAKKEMPLEMQNWVIDNFSGYHSTTESTRGWLFILKDTATAAENGAITTDGNDIISTAKFARVAKEVDGEVVGTNKLSSVFSYNYDRGMSVVKNENIVIEDKIGEGNTSDVMGYSNLTSFGAIEYWQKPTDFDDKTAPTLVDASAPYASVEPESVTISLKIQDETDLRYVELYTRKAGETEFIKTSTDYVLETCVANAGVAEDVNTEQTYSYEITEPGQMVEYYARAVDGNGNETLLGSEEVPLLLTGLRKIELYSAEVAKTKIGIEAPICESDTDGSYVFAGWYADDACTKTPIRIAEEVTGDTVYALFVTKDVLSVKAQLAVQSADDTKTNLRFVTTVDSLRYKEAGFDITISGTNYHMPSDTVYTKLYAVNKDQSVDTLYPQLFSDVSNYFWAVTVTGIPESAWDDVITAQPYWITMDGITVYGESAGKSVTQGMTGSEAKIANTYYHTFDAAFANAVNGDTIELFKDATIEQTYAVDKNLTITNALGNNVTLTRSVEDAMFTVASGATLTIEGDESNTITLDGDKTAITATNSMIVNAGTFTLGENASLINGGADSLNYGGALRNTGTATLQGTISGHSAVNGGAIYNYGAGEIIYNGGTYTSNTSIGRGGVMYGAGTSNTIVTDGTFSQNVAQGQYGGGAFGIAGTASLTVNGGTFTGNSANNASYTGTSAYGGGAIETNGDLTINGGTFESNTAYNGGAIYLDSSCNATITAGTFGSADKGNTAENSGGAIYLKKSSSAGATLTIEDGTFAYNEAAGTTGGGAIAGAALTTVDIQGGTFSNNSATTTSTADDTYGGGAIQSAGTVTISNGAFEANQSRKGGVIYIVEEGQLNISGGTFGGADGKGNKATYRGAVIYMHDRTAESETANADIQGATFSYNSVSNTSAVSGGVMFLGANTKTAITQCTFSNNKADATSSTSYGGVFYLVNASVTVDGGTFESNYADRGGGIYIAETNSDCSLNNCIFTDNTCNDYGKDIFYNAGNLTLSGKITVDIDKRALTIQVEGALQEGSVVQISQISTTSNYVQLQFDSLESLEQSKNYINYVHKNNFATSRSLTYDTEKLQAILQ